MASTVRTTGAPSGQPTQSGINVSKADFVAGGIISAQAIDRLRVLINAICGHTHELRDYSKISEYGNSGSTASTVENTQAAGTDATYNPAAGDSITAAGFNNLRSAVASVRSHKHVWNDN